MNATEMDLFVMSEAELSFLPLQDYYSIPFATPTTALTGREGSLTSNPYSGKMLIYLFFLNLVCALHSASGQGTQRVVSPVLHYRKQFLNSFY